jgi:hypothetical protein
MIALKPGVTYYKMEDVNYLFGELKSQAVQINSSFRSRNQTIHDEFYLLNQISTDQYRDAKIKILEQFLNDHRELQDGLAKLGDLILEVPTLSHAHLDSVHVEEHSTIDNTLIVSEKLMPLEDHQFQEDVVLKTPETMESPQLQQASSHSPPITYITVKYNAGYGNFISICGTGPNMSWDPEKALLLRCVGKDTWVYETSDLFEPFHCKILLNNKIWERGSDHIIDRNNPMEFSPHFSV